MTRDDEEHFCVRGESSGDSWLPRNKYQFEVCCDTPTLSKQMEMESFYFQYSNTGLCKRNKRALESFNKRVLKLFFGDVSNTDAPL